MVDTPLKEADPNSINELFNRDPLELTSEDVTKIAEALRRDRLAWVAEEEAARKAGRKPSAAKAVKNKPQVNLSFEDLGL